MSYNDILPDFSICSWVEELLYFPYSPPWPLAAPAADCPGRLLRRSAETPPNPAAARVLRRRVLGGVPPASLRRRPCTVGDGLSEEGEEKKEGEEKMRGDESDGKRKWGEEKIGKEKRNQGKQEKKRKKRKEKETIII